MEALNVDRLVNQAFDEKNSAIAEILKAECVLVNSGMIPPLHDEFRVAIEALKEDNPKMDHLAVVLETRGGSMEVVERLVAVMRHHYSEVSFVIPNYAYSAGTVLALSGDHIYMDYYSVLGPIDPQYRTTDGNFLPGHGVIAKFKELISEINKAGSINAVRAELAFFLKNFVPAELFSIEQSIEHGITLITEWLPQYKFKNWDKTEGQGNDVTDAMKRARAKEIAETLGDASKWHSHGRGISMNRLVGDEIKLKIDDFGADPKLSEHIRNYHGLAVDYFDKLPIRGYIHTRIETREIG